MDTMSLPLLFLFFSFQRLLLFLPTVLPQPLPPPPPPPPPKGSYYIDCGASAAHTTPDGLNWLPDDESIVISGTSHNISLPGIFPVFSTLRSFPFSLSSFAAHRRKFCYVLPAFQKRRYLVRTAYFYGGFDGRASPPVFDQIVDGTFWTMVNTTADYAAGESSYYEGVFMAQKRKISICVAGNAAYTKSDPFISALEVVPLDDVVYNSTNFNISAMGLLARSAFGSSGEIVRYPDDIYDRYWQPLADKTHSVSSTHNVSVSDFWNRPPPKLFNTALVADEGKPLIFQWPHVILPNASYYIALYFADTLPSSSRTFDVLLNEYSFYNNLEVTSSGVAVFSTEWILSGLTKIMLIPSGSSLPPVINGGEVFGLFPLGRMTHTKDIRALMSIKERIDNPPVDWAGDPCMPIDYPWTGITCYNGSRIRVTSLNLSSLELTGTLSPSISDLTALTAVSFADNKFSGPIPNLTKLKNLEKLHLQDNHLTGTISPSLAELPKLHELYLENNDLTGVVPEVLKKKLKSGLRYTPGNHFSTQP